MKLKISFDLTIIALSLALSSCQTSHEEPPTTQETNQETIANLQRNLAAQDYDEHLVDLKDFLASFNQPLPIIIKMAYASSNNFTGRRVQGYDANKCLVTRKAGEALYQIQKKLLAQSLSLVMKDCYRPVKASDDLHSWAHQDRPSIVGKYLSPVVRNGGKVTFASQHCSGSTVDLTLASITNVNGEINNYVELNMGTEYDSFSDLAHWSAKNLSSNPTENIQILTNRQILKNAMNGYFYPYYREWWHWTLNGQPYKGIYFNYNVK